MTIKLHAPTSSTQKLKLMGERWAIHLYSNNDETLNSKDIDNFFFGKNSLIGFEMQNELHHCIPLTETIN
jgi:hypothetical protein